MDVYSTFTTFTDNAYDATNTDFCGSMEGHLNFGNQYCAETKTDSFSVLFKNTFTFRTPFGYELCAPPANSLIYPPPSPPDSDFNQLFSFLVSEPPDLSSPNGSSLGTSSESPFNAEEALSPFSTVDARSSEQISINKYNDELHTRRAPSAQLDHNDTPSPASAEPVAEKKIKTEIYSPKSSVLTATDPPQSGGKVKKRRGRPRVENTELRQARHRERNRLAASRCRIKQRRRTSELEVKAEEMDAQNAQLLKLKDELREQVLRLQADVLKHKSSCSCSRGGGRSGLSDLVELPGPEVSW